MSKQPTLTTISSGYYSTTALNSNYTAIQTAFNNTLSLDGSTPNTMTADFDLGNQDLLNGNYGYFSRMYLNGSRVTALSSTPDWQGTWVTSTAYDIDDLVQESGNTYICLEGHTSGTFSTDLAANKWELFAAKGSSGAGSGDLVAANNLSDVSDADTALANLGGGTKGIAIFKDTTSAAVVSELGITATIAELNYVDGVTSNVQTQLDSKQSSDATLTALASSLTAANKVPYATDTDTLGELDLQTTITDSDTSLPTSGAVVDYVAANAASSMIFLASQDASSSATLDFTQFTAGTYDSYVFILQNIIPSSSSQTLLMRTSTDGGSTYDSSAGNYEWAQHGMINSASHSEDNISSQTSIKLTGDQANTYVSTTAGVSGRVEVLGPHLTQWTMINAGLSYVSNNGNRPAIINTAGHRESAADVDAVRFLFSSGNIASGTITMYGLKNS